MQLADLPSDVQLKIAQELDLSDWLSMKLSCKALLSQYNKPTFWNWGFRHLFLDTYTVEHPKFSRFAFDATTLIKALFERKRKRALAKALRYGVEPWQLAAFMGQVKPLCDIYGDSVINLCDENLYYVIEYLVIGGHIEDAIGWIKSRQPDFTAKDDEDYHFATLAVMTGDIPMLERFVNEFGYDLNHFDAKKQCTLLHTAVEYDQDDMFDYLIQNGVDIKLGSNLAVLAAKNGCWELYNKLVNVYKINPFDTPENQRLMVLSAIRFGRLELAHKTIQTYSVSPRSEKPEESFFYAAILSGDPEIFRIALRSGWGKITDIFEQDKNSLHIAADHGHISLIQTIVTDYPTEISPEELDYKGRSLLCCAANHGSSKKFQELLNICLSPYWLTQLARFGFSIAHFAAKSYQLNFLVEFHRKYGDEILADIDHDQNNILHLAVEAGAVSVSRWLIQQHSYSPIALNKFNDTPLHLLALNAQKNPALWCKFELMVDFIDFSILTEYRNNSDQTIKDIMLESGEEERFDTLNQRALEDKETSLAGDSKRMTTLNNAEQSEEPVDLQFSLGNK